MRDLHIVFLTLSALATVSCAPRAPEKRGPRRLYEGEALPAQQAVTLKARYSGVVGEAKLKGESSAKLVLLRDEGDGKWSVLLPDEPKAPKGSDEAKRRKVGLAAINAGFALHACDGSQLAPPVVAKPEKPVWLELAPGRHSVEFRVLFVGTLMTPRGQATIGGRTRDVALVFDGKPGRTYELKTKPLSRLRRWEIWLEDDAGDRVSPLLIATEGEPERR